MATELKQELKIDNNTKLLLMIEIFQNGQNEELIKIFHATRGHTQGEVESLNILISSFGIYFLIRKESSENEIPESQGQTKITNKFKKESFISFNQMDYIEVALCDQAIHFVCINKRQTCWLTTASRLLTKSILESIESGRSQNTSLKFPKLSVFHEAMQQKLAINKFIAQEENVDPHDIEIRNYSLVYWEDQTAVVNHLIHKEGNLYYYKKQSGMVTDWRKAYFVLKNDVLTQYRTQNDKRPAQVIKLNGEDFSGCRKYTKSSKLHTIELILSDSHVLYLSAKTEAEASDWLQCFCKIISLGNLHTDVPTNTCLPCCSITTNNKLYFCHEDLNTGFYRLLETIKMQEINRISFDNENPFYCILHDDNDQASNRYWFVYFIDELERNEFISEFKKSWDIIFQIPLTIEKCKSSEMRKRCIRGVRLIHKLWDWDDADY
jgi:pleckstrin family protein M 2